MARLGGAPGARTRAQVGRRRVEQHVPARLADRELKLGPGGLRDVEFAVQLLQLVHGRTDDSLRSGSTLPALEALSRGGYVGREDAAALATAYRLLRTLEHRIQLHRLRRTHLVPEAEADLRRLGRSLGYRTDPVAELDEQWRRHAREVRRLHEKLFYRPLLHAVAAVEMDESRLSAEAARERLAILDQAKSNFLRVISHELRTPLNGLFGIAELLFSACPDDADGAEMKEHFRQSRSRLLALVDDALLLTQIDVGPGEFAPRLVELDSALRAACDADPATGYHLVGRIAELAIGHLHAARTQLLDLTSDPRRR